jgi:MEMO1 family protein
MPSLKLPKLRPVEVFPVEQDGERLLVVNDPSNLSVGNIVIAGPALYVFSLLDGRHDLEEIQQEFEKQYGQALPREELEEMLAQLDAAHYLDSDNFANYFKSLVDDYRVAPARVSGNGAGLGLNGNYAGTIREMMSRCEVALTGNGERRLAGLVAPHLDYARGTPCYADAYGVLATMPAAKRFIILGTNHFGRATSTVATRKDFQTALGTTRTDREFIAALEQRCDADLCEHEFDHLREHSVELQVLVLQHLFGSQNFEIVPVLCQDPCGPTGTGPYDGRGVDLHVFAEALGELVRKDDTPTVIIAGADLSHVGRRFGDSRDLDATFLSEIDRYDRKALAAVSKNDNAKFLNILTDAGNETRICSVGCIYALMTALPDARAELLRYHQAADSKTDTCVTCAAVAFWS